MKHLLLLLLLLVSVSMLPKYAAAQEFIVRDYPPDSGFSIGASFYEKHHDMFWQVADLLRKDSTLDAYVFGRADGLEYVQNHDAKNAGIASSRAISVRNILISNFGCDSTRVFTQADVSEKKGGEYRSVKIVLLRKASFGPPEKPKRDTVIREEIIYERVSDHPIVQEYFDFFCLAELGVGLTITPFGKPTPVIRGRLGNPTISFDTEFGFSPATNEWRINESRYDANFRLVSGHVSIALSQKHPIDLVLGWDRNEERSPDFGRYLRKREGPVTGLGYTYHERLNVRAYWSPYEEDVYGKRFVTRHYNAFRIEVLIVNLWRK